MKVVSYRMFSSSEEFEKWQVENDEVRIISITPVVGGIGGIGGEEWEPIKDKDSSINYDFKTSINVFVTFFKEV